MATKKQKGRATRTMYMHTLDGKPASYSNVHGSPSLGHAGKGHRTRAASLVSSLEQIRRERQACIREDWRFWTEMKPEYRPAERPNGKRYGYVLVEVPSNV